MDVASYLQLFESNMDTFVGDDPLEQWDKFVMLLLRKFPDNDSQLSAVLHRLVETFLNVEKYANDERFINYCIKYASSYADPIALYSHIFSKGVGTRSAALYVSWAQQLEQRGMCDQAEKVYQKGLEKQAQPTDYVHSEYRQFQSRTKCPVAALSVRNPLQSSNSVNVMPTQEPAVQNKESVDCQPAKPAERKYVVMISRSEYSGKLPPSSNENLVPAYDKEMLQCEGSEFCFEEVRAQRYFQKIKERQQREQQEEAERKERTVIDENQTVTKQDIFRKFLSTLNEFPNNKSHMKAAPHPGPDHHPGTHPHHSVVPGNSLTLGLRLQSEPPFINQAHVPSEPEPFMGQSRVSATGQSQHVPVPFPHMSHEAPALALGLSLHTPVLPTMMSPHAPVPAASMSHHPSVPTTSTSHPAPAVPMSHFPAVPTTSMSHQAVLPQGVAPYNCPPKNEHKNNVDPLEPEHEANISQGGTANLSHITPNNSLGYVQATPSRVLPSPTVNTREALDVIMGMFQAPTLLEEPFPNASADTNYNLIYTRNGPMVKPTTTTPFTIFQDEAESEDKENSKASVAVSDKFKKVKALAELQKPTKPNVTSIELPSDESTIWGAPFNAQHSLAACPNSTTDFAMLARFVSTPMSTGINFFPEEENDEEGEEEEWFARRYAKKLSPIMEQSPMDSNKAVVVHQSLSSQQGTVMGEALAMNTQFLTTSGTTMVQPPPPAVLSFRDHTLGLHNSSVHRSTGPGFEVYVSPESTPEHKPFTIKEEVEKQQPNIISLQDVPMNSESAPSRDWLNIQSPEKSAEQDLDTFLSPHRPESPRMPQLSQDIPMSPQVESSTDAHMMSPDKDMRSSMDVSMNPKTPRRSLAGPVMHLVPDPWNDDLIVHLLSSMDPPLTKHPRCVTWQCNIPNIASKKTLTMGNASLRVDGVLGEGGFAKVFQATDSLTSDKMVLKVQKPANPWEFYINTQLDARVPSSMRHFYSSFHSAYLFNNGSVLLGEMHKYGTLLNTVNMYRTQGHKVMPQPLVLYFTVCILHMIEQLHSIGIVHADVKPDNFLLSERFLENKSFGADDLDHGLVLFDLGQSIDMRLFPEGTAFTAKCLTSGFQCTEMQTGKPWNYQTDLFGVAGTVYCMLFGTYMQVVNDGGVWRTNGTFRRNPHSDLWQEFFHTLLNIPDCSSLPDLRALRHKLQSVLDQNYKNKLASLKSRLVVLVLESSRKAARR